MLIAIRTLWCEQRKCTEYHKKVIIADEKRYEGDGIDVCAECHKDLIELERIARDQFPLTLISELNNAGI